MHGRQLPCLQGRNLICTALCIQIPHSSSPITGVGATEVEPPHLFAIHAVFAIVASQPCLNLLNGDRHAQDALFLHPAAGSIITYQCDFRSQGRMILGKHGKWP
jgi:hypothetical protein